MSTWRDLIECTYKNVLHCQYIETNLLMTLCYFFYLNRKLSLISMITKYHLLAKMFLAIAAYVSIRNNVLHLVALVHIKLNIYQKILQLLVFW
jgi:hypothetical protein